MAGDPLARTDGIRKTFAAGDRPAIAELSFEVAPAQVTGLVGPDGAGKTTLMRLLAGLMLPDSGRITVCGFDTSGDLSGIRQAVSYMPQRFGLYEDLSVAENLSLYADLRGVVGQDRQKAFEQLLQFTNLAPFTDRLAGRLSGGMKQKLGLACALIRAPRLLLLDEPSVGVDPISRRELWRMVYALVDQGIGVVWSTAYLDEAERCASVLLLNEGKTLYNGPPKELTERVTGRVFLLRNLGDSRRQVLTRAIKQPGVVDAVIQGSSVRVVMAEKQAAPDAATFGVDQAAVEATAPRFEDAFVDLLGGGPKGESALAGSNRPEQTGSAKSQLRPAGATGSLPASASQTRADKPPVAPRTGTFQQLQQPAIDASVVEAHDLTKTFGSFTAVDHVSFSIQRGEIFGLLGPNGAGKSTTFKMMCGLLRPSDGMARVAGYDLYRAGGAARLRLGYMAQKFSLYGDLSVRQNLDFFAGIYGLSREQRRAAIDRMTEAFVLQPYLNQNAGELPLGYKQRLALACAVMHRPAVLFLDEPTSGVDPLTRREFWSHINAMVEQGVTVMVTTHFLDEAEYCDRVGLVYQGHVIAEGSPDDLKNSIRRTDQTEPTLEDAFIELVEDYDRNSKAKTA